MNAPSERRIMGPFEFWKFVLNIRIFSLFLGLGSSFLILKKCLLLQRTLYIGPFERLIVYRFHQLLQSLSLSLSLFILIVSTKGQGVTSPLGKCYVTGSFSSCGTVGDSFLEMKGHTKFKHILFYIILNLVVYIRRFTKHRKKKQNKQKQKQIITRNTIFAGTREARIKFF